MTRKSWRAIEEIAKLEQRTAMRHGKFVSLIHTPSIKSLSNSEKEEFFNYMKSRGKIGKFLSVIILFSFLIPLVFRKEILGNAVIENISSANSFSYFVIGYTLFLILAILILNFVMRKNRDRQFDRHVLLAERAIHKFSK